MLTSHFVDVNSNFFSLVSLHRLRAGVAAVRVALVNDGFCDAVEHGDVNGLLDGLSIGFPGGNTDLLLLRLENLDSVGCILATAFHARTGRAAVTAIAGLNSIFKEFVQYKTRGYKKFSDEFTYSAMIIASCVRLDHGRRTWDTYIHYVDKDEASKPNVEISQLLYTNVVFCDICSVFVYIGYWI